MSCVKRQSERHAPDRWRVRCADDEKENQVNDKGKAPMRAEDVAACAAADADRAGDEDNDEDDDDGDEDGGGEGDDDNGEGGDLADNDGGDMQLAWEMLEVARAIYAKSGAAHAAELAGARRAGPGTLKHNCRCWARCGHPQRCCRRPQRPCGVVLAAATLSGAAPFASPNRTGRALLKSIFLLPRQPYVRGSS